MNCYWFSIAHASLLFNNNNYNFPSSGSRHNSGSFKPERERANSSCSRNAILHFRLFLCRARCQFSWEEAAAARRSMRKRNGWKWEIMRHFRCVLHFPSVVRLSASEIAFSCKCQRDRCGAGNVNWYTHKHEWWCDICIYNMHIYEYWAIETCFN